MLDTGTSPTSVRLTVKARRLLDEAISVTGQSRSQLVNQAVEAHLPRVVSRASRTPEERLAWIGDIAAIGDRHGLARNTDDIDASIRETRGDR
jgi:hypothetical protein